MRVVLPATRNFLKGKQIKVIPRPGNSPYLNHIENVWDIMKNKLANNFSTNKQDRIKKIKTV